MPVPIPGAKVGSDNVKVKCLRIFGTPLGVSQGTPGVPVGADPYPEQSAVAMSHRRGLEPAAVLSLGERGSHGGPPRNHPGETVYPPETLGISSSGPKDKIGRVFGNTCADSGLKSWV